MKEHPILFSGPMVRAILEGRKTQTRRVIVPQPGGMEDERRQLSVQSDGERRYGKPGDLLWVRETWDFMPWDHGCVRISYGADGEQRQIEPTKDWNPTLYGKQRWRPSIHMPRWASRLTLRITDVRVQRLQEIGLDDIGAEGGDTRICDSGCTCPHDKFRALWDSINGKRAPWSSNPWVWAISFERVTA